MKPSSSKHALSPDRNHPELSTILWPFLPKYFVAIEGFFISNSPSSEIFISVPSKAFPTVPRRKQLGH